jgi:23S rRNA (uracil1939-C5)-methyltransferase
MKTLGIDDTIELSIAHLAGLGDGVGSYADIPVFVPYTCAGDTVRVRIERMGKGVAYARLIDVLHPSPHRQAPPCPRFSRCGGCGLQHLAPQNYRDFKRGIALHVADQLQLEHARVAPLFEAGDASRRRAELKVNVHKGEVTLGFLASQSHEVVDATPCKVVSPAIAAAIGAVRTCLANLKKPSLIKALHITEADNGLDIQLQATAKLKPADAQSLQTFADAEEIERLLLMYDDGATTMLKVGEPQVSMGTAQIALQSGGFLQATKASQNALADYVVQHCAGHASVADIYCGSGTFSLPLLQAGHRVYAYEGSADAVTTLFNAARKQGWEQQLHSHSRDIYAQPLRAEELAACEAVVINPPRNGALPQANMLAQSPVQKVVMVSCNPATFVRDARALLDGGFGLQHMLPVDQFTWSHHLELAAVFSRNAQ